MSAHPRMVEVRQQILKKNDMIARALRERFHEAGVYVVSLVSSPGSGKTAFLEKTLGMLRERCRVAALVGDLATDNDARRLARSGAPVKQIITGTVCHLEAEMVRAALDGWRRPEELDFLFIENVGNLVCPAAFDLGQHRNVVLLSVTEGDDKPVKYPVMFRAADLVLISKSDLAPYIDDFDRGRAEHALRRIACAAPVFTLSARRCTALDPWLDWLRAMSAEARVPA